jgi:hypothetical protein
MQTARREAERGQVVADILYLEVARQLQAAGMQLLNNLALLSPNISQPPPDFMSAEGLQQLLQQHGDGPSSSSSSSSLVSPAVADAVVSYLASTFEGGDARMMDAAAPPVTPLSVDRLQVGGSSSSSGRTTLGVTWFLSVSKDHMLESCGSHRSLWTPCRWVAAAAVLTLRTYGVSWSIQLCKGWMLQSCQ